MRRAARAVVRACCLRPCGGKVAGQAKQTAGDGQLGDNSGEFGGKQIGRRASDPDRLDRICELDDQQDDNMLASVPTQRDANRPEYESQRNLISPSTGSSSLANGAGRIPVDAHADGPSKDDNRGQNFGKEGSARRSSTRPQSRVAQATLVLGAGGDNQSHVIRPRTANIKQLKNKLQRVSSGLETITERQEEQALAMSQGGNRNMLVDIEESHSFSLRNYSQKGSARNLENTCGRLGERLGELSGLSNYSKIKADT